MVVRERKKEINENDMTVVVVVGEEREEKKGKRERDIEKGAGSNLGPR